MICPGLSARRPDLAPRSTGPGKKHHGPFRKSRLERYETRKRPVMVFAEPSVVHQDPLAMERAPWG
jgi:hypothetical protein